MPITPDSTQEDTTVSDYDAEWGLDNDSPEDSGVDAHKQEDRKTPDEPTATQDGADANSKGTQSQDGTDTTAAEQEDADPWATAPDELRQAWRKAEMDLKASKGRAAVAQSREARLKQELEEQRKLNAELAEKAREPTAFEREHPEYAEDIKQLLNERGTPVQQPVPEVDEADSDATIKAILAEHSDAGEYWAKPEFHQWVEAQPEDVRALVNSSDAGDAIGLLTAYKSSQADAAREKLAGFSQPRGTQSKPDLRHPSNLSAQERYDAEWEED